MNKNEINLELSKRIAKNKLGRYYSYFTEVVLNCSIKVKKKHFKIADLDSTIKRTYKIEIKKRQISAELNKLASISIVDRLFLPTLDSFVYEFQNTKHFHLLCINCKTIIEVQDIRMSDIVSDINKQIKFETTNIELLISGRCDTCQAKLKNKLL